jgi:hypothetical protein
VSVKKSTAKASVKKEEPAPRSKPSTAKKQQAEIAVEEVVVPGIIATP